MRTWIDLANSPHPLLFGPVARRLEELGHELLWSARDNAQTVELARQHFRDVELIGGASPAGRAAKARTMAARIGELTRWARSRRPELALSHNSYGQIVAARALGIPAVTAMDFEHQPLNHLAFRLARRVLLPAALARTDVRRQGATRRRVRFYDGLKEEIYLGDFEPDPGVLQAAGLERGPGTALVVARTPPSRAIYHRFGNSLFLDALRAVGGCPHAVCVVLTRHPEQREAIAALGLSKLVMPERALDSRSLMWEADLVLGAGGTMTREAALLGVPTFSLFAGATPAVDRWLEERGALRQLRSASELLPLRPRARPPHDLPGLRRRSDELVDVFARAATEGWTRPVRARVAVAARG
ncbi:MAG: DUF354 domain-containing protein [Thermoleophilaceae bacterium]